MADDPTLPRFTPAEYVVHRTRRDEVARYHVLVDGPKPESAELMGLAGEMRATIAELKRLPNLAWFAKDHTKRRKHLEYMAGERQTVPGNGELEFARQRFVVEGDGFATADEVKEAVSVARYVYFRGLAKRLRSPRSWRRPTKGFWEWGTSPVCPPSHRLPLERAMELLQEAYDFTDDDLAANREGRLTVEQAERHGIRVTRKVRRVAGPVVKDHTGRDVAGIIAGRRSRRFRYTDALAAGVPEAILYWGQGRGRTRVFSIEPYESGELEG